MKAVVGIFADNHLYFIKEKSNCEQISFLNEILKTSSPSECEGELVSLLRERMMNYCKIETDTIGNLYMGLKESNLIP